MTRLEMKHPCEEVWKAGTAEISFFSLVQSLSSDSIILMASRKFMWCIVDYPKPQVTKKCEQYNTYCLFFSLKVLFIFDSRFTREFEGKDGKTADEHMNEAIAVVRNAFADRTLRNEIGTTINVIAEKRTHPRSM